MVVEKYNLICRGETVEGVEKTALVPQLAKLFNTDEKNITQIFSPKLKILVRNLSWNKAVKYQNKLRAAGLVVYLDVVLSAEIFRESLVSVSSNKNKACTGLKSNVGLNKDNASDDIIRPHSYTQLKFNRNKLIPAMIYPPHSEMLSDEEGTTTFTIQSYNFSINSIFIIITSLFSALLIQRYFTMVMVVSIPHPIVTITSITIFLSVIMFLPKIMTPSRIFSLREEKSDKPYLLCSQLPSFNIFVSRYEIYSDENVVLASVKYNKLKSHYECFDENENILFTSSEEHDIDEFTKGVTEELRDELFDLYYLKYIKSISKGFKKIDAWLKKKPQTCSREDGFVIRDSSSKKIANFHRDKISVIEIPEKHDDTKKQKIMTAFLLICVGID